MFPKQQIDGFERYWRRRKPGSSTALHYASDVNIFFKWAEGQIPEAITVHEVDEFIGWQQDLGRAQATIRRRLIALRMFYDYLTYVCEEEIDNPVITQRHYIDQDHRLPRDIRQSDIERLFTAIGNHLRDRTIFTLMLHTGIRVGEVVHLRLADVYLFENRPPHLRVIGKGQRERVAYLSATATLLLKEYLSERSDKTEGKVFLNRRGRPITITGIQLQLAKYCHQADIWVTCHQLRHTFACRMIAAGVPVTSVQKMLGHTSLRTTQLYVNVADRQVEQDYHTGIQKVIENCATLSEVSRGVPVTAQRLRHTFASQMLGAGMPVSSLQRFLGHEHLDTTMIYAEVSDPLLRQDYYQGIATLDPGSKKFSTYGLGLPQQRRLRHLVEELKTPGLNQSRHDEILDIILANIS